MQVYFIKARYTNNLYLISDFYDTEGEYKLNVSKMLNINLDADDGITSFKTSKITLPDETSIRNYTHIIVPELEKIYKITSIDYMNSEQLHVLLDEDPFIANYQELKDASLFLMRSNDEALFRGVNDINDMTLKESVEVQTVESSYKTGKWALLFFQLDLDNDYIGLKFDPQTDQSYREQFSSFASLFLSYPEVSTDQPSKYSYFQKVVYVLNEGLPYQCVHDGTRLKWVEFLRNEGGVEKYYASVNGLTDTHAPKINETDVKTVVLALPFESDLYINDGANRLLNFHDFIGPITAGQLIDIKIIDSNLLIKPDAISYTLEADSNGNPNRKLIKNISGFNGSGFVVGLYDDTSASNEYNQRIMRLTRFEDTIDLTPTYTNDPTKPLYAEPFCKYDLYVYGTRFNIPAYLTDNIKMKIAVNSGVVNYIIYYNDLRNILGSGSFTHSVKYQVDQLDAFYNQNPTYKDQFFTKMGVDAMKGVIGGAVAGSVVPGVGTLAGAGAGLIGAGVDAGLSMINFNFMQKGLKLKPDQMFGENSEISLLVKNIFGIYWVKRTSENVDFMINEWGLIGFPVSTYTKISDLNKNMTSIRLGKIVFGELKSIVKNEFVTGYINQKLKEGVILF